MEEHIEIIERAIFEFEESGRASRTAMARCIIGELEKQGYTLSKECEHPYKYITGKLAGLPKCQKCGTYL